jgi:hypothetical protein
MDDEDDPTDEHRSDVAHADARGGAGIGSGRARAPLPRGEGERAREDAGDPPGVGAALDESLEAHPAGGGRSIDLVPEHLRRDAEEEAERILAEANAEAERVRAEARAIRDAAQAAAEALLHDAQARAQQLSAGAGIEQPLPDPPVLRDVVVGDLQKLSRRVTNALKDLQATIEAADDDRLRAEAEGLQPGGAS